jgi:hypothetical protein
VKLHTGRGKLLHFGLCAPEEEGVEENENFYNKLQEILHKTNKNRYILLSGNLGAKIGNAEIHNIVGSFGEQVTNTNGLKLRNFATYNNIEIVKSLCIHNNIHTYIHTHTHTHTWPACNSKRVIQTIALHTESYQNYAWT